MLETAEEKPSLIQDTVQKGLILGTIHVLVNALLYFLLPSKLTGFSYLFFILALNIGYCIYYGRIYRIENGGFIDFGKAFIYAALILAINGALSSLVFPLVLSLVDSSYAEVMAQSQIDTQMYWMHTFGAPESAIDEARDKLSLEEVAKQHSPVKILIGFGIALFLYALGGVIVAFSVRKTEPEVM